MDEIDASAAPVAENEPVRDVEVTIRDVSLADMAPGVVFDCADRVVGSNSPSHAHQGRAYTRVCRAITGELWAIQPEGLERITQIVRMHQISGGRDEGAEYVKREYEISAGPGAQRLPGAQRAYLVDGVAVLPVTGPIFPRANMMTEMSGATSIATLTADYMTALNNAEVGAIILKVDSPGGAVSGISTFVDAVSAGKKKKYTMAYVDHLGASAAYWIASAASEVWMERTAMVGSIGVVTAIPAQVAPNSDGEFFVEIVSSNAPKKRPNPLSEEGRGDIVAMLDGMEAQFIGDVANGRGVSVDKVKTDFGQGGVHHAAAAVKAGMADKVASYEAALGAMRRKVANERKLAALRKG